MPNNFVNGTNTNMQYGVVNNGLQQVNNAEPVSGDDNHAPSLPKIQRYNPYDMPQNNIYPTIQTETNNVQNVPTVPTVTNNVLPANNNVAPVVPQEQVQPQVINNQAYQTYQPTPNATIPSANGVNIVIYNPTAVPNGTVYNNAPIPKQPVTYPQNYYTMQNPMGNNMAAAPMNRDEKKDIEPPKKKEKEIVQLTDEYIRTLENYLDNPNVKIREMGMKELIARFKEDETRKNDIALIALLNKALQDPKQSVRFMALSTLNADYAIGDRLTYALLADMQHSDKVYGEDAVLASNIMLKHSGNKIKVDDNSPQIETNNGQNAQKAKEVNNG